MVLIGKNLGQFKDGMQLNNSNFNSNELDEIFAELFSLVDFSNLEETNLDETEQNVFSQKNLDQSNEIDTAKSLISIFYKEMNLNEHKDSEFDLITNNEENENQTNTQLIQNSLIAKKKIDKIINKEIENKNDLRSKYFFENLHTKSIPQKINKKGRKNLDNLINERSTLAENNKELKKEINKKFSNENIKTKNLNNSAIQKINENMIKKKERKKSELNENLKLEVIFTKKDKNVTQSKSAFLSNVKFSSNDKKLNTNLNINKTNDKENSKIFNKEQNLSSNFNSQEVLDLLESSWGEKLVKLIQNSLKRGLQKIDISLEPKNLGKIKVEIDVINDKTDIKIIADNKVTASILNDNQLKLNQMLEKESINLGSFTSNSDSNNSSSNFKENKDNEKNKEMKKNLNIKSETDNTTTYFKRKTIHNVDINA